jgi:hypothetical protein
VNIHSRATELLYKCMLLVQEHYHVQEELPHVQCTGSVPSAKRYTKKPRQTLVSSSLNLLGLSEVVAHVFVCKRLVCWIRGGGGVRCVYYIVDLQWCAKLQLLHLFFVITSNVSLHFKYQ